MLQGISRAAILATFAALAVSTAGCTGRIGEAGGSNPAPGDNGADPGDWQDREPTNPDLGNPGADAQAVVARSGIRRLTQREYDNAVRDLLGDMTGAGTRNLPTDDRTPFDNSYINQNVSASLIEGAETAASEISTKLIADAPRLSKTLGCKPAGADDATCMGSFVKAFGRRALRRTMADSEVDKWVAFARPHAMTAGNFNGAVDVLVRAFLQHPEFLYRVELGTAVPGFKGRFLLTPFEVATRLSFLMWGTTPEDRLLDLAEAGQIKFPEDLKGVAAEMWKDPRTLDQLDFMHAAWMGYDFVSKSTMLGGLMRNETRALIERALVKDGQPWNALFNATDTYVDATLAKHYGLPAPASGSAWVSYGATGRKGILSHGGFLSIGGKFGDTSPVRRAVMIRERLLCETIAPPPPNVDPTVAPKSPTSPCKTARYEAHRSNTACAGCHSALDPLGFGLENYDSDGKYRTAEPNLAECTISGDGELVPFGKFKGPAELSDLLVKNGMSACFTENVYRFAVGRQALDTGDKTWVKSLEAAAGAANMKLDQLVLGYVTSDAFFYRQEQE